MSTENDDACTWKNAANKTVADLRFSKGGFQYARSRKILNHAHFMCDHAYFYFTKYEKLRVNYDVCQSISICSVSLVGELKPESFGS